MKRGLLPSLAPHGPGGSESAARALQSANALWSGRLQPASDASGMPIQDHGMPDAFVETITKFIARSKKSGGSEKANYALFFTELCDEILQVPHPEPAGPDNAKNRYVFERAVTYRKADCNNERFPDPGSCRSQISRFASQRVWSSIDLAKGARTPKRTRPNAATRH